MSTEPDFMWIFLSKAGLPSVVPLSQADAPSADSFDNEIEGLEFDDTVPLPALDDNLSNFRDSTPVFTSPSVISHSTESAYDIAASEYSYDHCPPSNYSMPLDVAFRSVRVSSECGEIETKHDPIYPSPFPNDSGALPPSSSASPPLRVAKAQSDYGPSKPPRHTHFTISPENLSLPQNTTPSAPAVLPVQATPDTQRHTGPGRMHQCPNCTRAFARVFNLKTHMDTHNLERK